MAGIKRKEEVEEKRYFTIFSASSSPLYLSMMDV